MSPASASAWWPRINVSLQAVAQVLLVILAGVWLAARKGFQRSQLDAVSSLNWFLLMPSLMFSSIVAAVTPHNLVLLWPLIVLSLIHVLLGVVPALLLCLVARLPRDLAFFTVMAASLPNCGNLPWLMMPTLVRSFTPPEQAAAQVAYSAGLTSVYTIMIILITLTVPFLFKRPHTLRLPRSRDSGQQQQQQQRQQQLGQQQQQLAGGGGDAGAAPVPHDVAGCAAADQLQPTAAAAAAPDVTGKDAAAPAVVALPPLATTSSSLELEEANSGLGGPGLPHHQPYVGGSETLSVHRSSSMLRNFSLRGSFSRGLQRSGSFVQLVWSFPQGWRPQGRQQQQQQHIAAPPAGPRWWQALCRGCAAVLAHPVVNLPLGATLLGIACAAVAPVRNVLVVDQAALSWLFLGLQWIGAACAPLATLQIGAELMQAAPGVASLKVPRRLQWTATAIASFVKLIVVPLLGVVLLRVAGMATLVPATDSVYQLLMLIQGAVPAAVSLLVTCSRVYPDIRPLSRLLFWQYVASLFTLPAFIVWFLAQLEL